MELDRRRFLSASAAAIAAAPLLSAAAPERGIQPAYKAVLFDAFPIFDPRPAFAVLQERLPEQGDVLRKLWFDKIFAYTWLRTAGGRYKDFQQVMSDALEHAAAALKIDIAPEDRAAILHAFTQLPVWPDVPESLERLRESGVRLGFLSNMTEEMLRSNLRHNGIEAHFEFVLSTDRAQAFKPAPAAYALGMEACGLAKEEILFAAFAGWDAAGAAWFGYPTVWVNRLGSAGDVLDAPGISEGAGLKAVSAIVLPGSRNA